MKDELTRYNTSPIPECDIWRISLLEKYISERLINYYNGCDSNEDLDDMIKSLVS